MERGVLYCVSNDEYYLNESIYSAKSFKKFNKNIPITLYTNLKNVNHPVFDKVVYDDDSSNPFKFKVKALNSFPYQTTLFIDSDTKICAPLYELFTFGEFYDIAIAHRIEAHWGESMKFIDYTDKSAYNTGVLLYRKSDSVEQFFEEWMSNVKKQDGNDMVAGRFCDQHYFNKMIFEENKGLAHNVKILNVSNKIYNARHMYNELKKDGILNEVKIWHSHGLNISFTNKVINKFKSYFN